MIEKISIKTDDLKVIRTISADLEKMAAFHSKIRREFVLIEAGVLNRMGILDKEFKTFFLEVCHVLGISENDAREWSLDVEEGCFFRQIEDSPDEEPETPEPAPEEAEPLLSHYEMIRRKYGA